VRVLGAAGRPTRRAAAIETDRLHPVQLEIRTGGVPMDLAGTSTCVVLTDRFGNFVATAELSIAAEPGQLLWTAGAIPPGEYSADLRIRLASGVEILAPAREPLKVTVTA